MIYELRLAPRAWRDLARLADFLSEKSPRAAARSQAAIWTAIQSLDRYPERGAPMPIDVARKLFVPFGRDVYLIEYHVQAEQVLILRIFHAREER